MIQAGQQAPDFTLELLDGGHITLAHLLETGPLALVFFKASCPTCQLALPFLDRLAGGALHVYAVSQDDAARTREFLRIFPLKMPVLLDPASAGYPASNSYGIQYVPSLFVIEPDGLISAVCEAFDRRAYEALGLRAGMPLFQPGEPVPLYKPG
jgi:peroxiredoxin